MKFNETKLNEMKEGSRQYLDQQERVLFGQAKRYREEESMRRDGVKQKEFETNEKAIWLMKGKGVNL